ncbi:MAG: hypothetical protein ACFNUS_01460 [Candidatus Saccharimonas sp.]
MSGRHKDFERTHQSGEEVIDLKDFAREALKDDFIKDLYGMAVVANDELDQEDENGFNSRGRFDIKYGEIETVLDTVRSGNVDKNATYDNSDTLKGLAEFAGQYSDLDDIDKENVDKVIEAYKTLINVMKARADVDFSREELGRLKEGSTEYESAKKGLDLDEGNYKELLESIGVDDLDAAYRNANPNDPPKPPVTQPGQSGTTPNHQPGQNLNRQPNPEKLPFFEDLDRYARLLAAEESKGGNRGIISRIWTSRENRRRAERLSYMRDVEDDLREQVMEHLSEKVNAKRQRGEYNGTDDEIAQQMSDEMFDEQRRIFGMIQRKKNEALEEEAGKWHNRVLAKLGSFIAARGSKKKSSLKAGAVGFAHGAVKGTAVGVISGLFGAVWPISMAAGAVASLAGDAAIRRGVRLDAMQQRRKKRGIREVAGDDEFSQIKEAAGRIGGLQGQQHVADELFKRTRKATEKDRDKISREVEQRIKDNGVALALGRLAGGAVGGLGGRWVGQQLHDHTPVGQAVDRAKRNVHEFFRGDTAAAATDNPPPPPPPPPPAPTEADFSGYTDKYPWDWAVDQFGENNAISKLYELADAAAQDGHKIQWHGYGDTQWLSIDGNSDTKTVLEILNNYK